MLKSSGRRIDLSRPFVDAMLPEGHRLHVVLEGISRGFSAVNIRKFVRAGRRRSTTSSALGSLSTAGRVVPRRVGPRRPQHPGRRRDAGRQDDLPQLPRRRRSRAASGWSVRRRSSSCGSGTRTGCPADAAERARGDRRDPAARAGQGEPADAAEPGHRRRGAGRGVPRPAARPQRRAAGDVHDPRQQRARGAGQGLHPAAAGRREHLGAVRGADGRRLGRPGRAPRHRRARRTPRQRGRRACPGGSRTTSSRPSRSSSATASTCVVRAGCRRGSSASSGSASTSTRSLRGGTRLAASHADGRAGRARCRVSGCCSSGRRSSCRRATGRRGASGRPGRASCWPGPGSARCRRPGSCCCASRPGVASAFVMQVVSRTPPVAVAFGAMGAWLPVAIVVRPGPAAPARARGGLARGGRQPRLGGARRDVAARRARPGWASAAPSRCGRRSTGSPSTTR